MTLPHVFKLEQQLYTEEFCKEFENALGELNVGKKFVVVCGTSFTKEIAEELIKKIHGYEFLPPIEVEKSTASAALKVQNASEKENAPVIGIGGGKVIDIAKKGGSDAKKPVIVVPTQPTHDGMVSPVASIGAPAIPYSVSVNPPIGAIIPMDIMYKASKEAVSQGTGDCIAKITANLDWKLSAELKLEKQKDPPFNEDISNLCLKSAMKIIENINKMRKEKEPFSPQNPYYKQYVSDLVDALISFGIYMCTVGSSVVASGTEHLWGHGLDVVASKYIPHGWGVGSGSGIAYYLFKRFRPEYCKPFNKILNNLKALLRYMGIPSTAKELGITKEEAIYSFLKAVEIGDERGRVTILDDIRLPYHEPSIKIDESFAREVLEATKII